MKSPFELGKVYKTTDVYYTDVLSDLEDMDVNLEALFKAGYGSDTGGIEFNEGTNFTCTFIDEEQSLVLMQPAGTNEKLTYYYDDEEVLELFGIES